MSTAIPQGCDFKWVRAERICANKMYKFSHLFNKMGMTKKQNASEPLSNEEKELLEQLREHPDLLVRFKSVLAITGTAGTARKTADEVEGLLIEELRRLGQTGMKQWAVGAEARSSQAFKEQEPQARSRKKKTLKWWCVFGLVEVRERIWRTPSQSYVRILPEQLGVTPRGRSHQLDRVLTDFGCEHSFLRAAESVQEHYGFALGASAIRAATLEHAQRARVQLQAGYAEPFRVLPATGAPQVIAQTDGTMICTVGPGKRKGSRPRAWQEMRLVATQAQAQVTTVYAATFGSVAEVGRRWGHCARDAGWGLNSQIHAVGDGADWIRLQSREVFREQGTFLCDFYHVSEYLGAAALTCAGSRAQPWRRTQQKRLRRGAVPLVIAALAEHLEPVETPEEEAPVRNAHRYLTNRTDCLDYPRALGLGLPIGSGLIESGHRHVLHARLKKAGTAWLHDTADQIAHLRVLRANRLWQSFWN